MTSRANPPCGNDQAKDRFDFVFKSKEEEESIKGKTVFDSQFKYHIYNYVIQKDTTSEQIGYAVYEEEIDMNKEDCLERLAFAWNHWIHHSSLNHYHGVRALAFRTSPVIPPAGQAALERYLEIETPSKQQTEAARSSLREALQSVQKLRLAIVMEEINGCIFSQLVSKREMRGSYSDLLTIVLHCFVALKEVHDAGLVLDALGLQDFVFIGETNFVKVVNYQHAKQTNKASDKSFIFIKRNGAPEHGENGEGPATSKADVYMLASCLDMFLRQWGYLFVQLAEREELIALMTGFLCPMLIRNPENRPSLHQILTEERFTRFFARAGVPTQAEIERTAKEMYDRTAEKYHLPKEVSTAETVAANLARCRNGQVKCTLVQETEAIPDLDRDDFVVPPPGVLPDDDVQNSSVRSCFVVARNFCCPCPDTRSK